MHVIFFFLYTSLTKAFLMGFESHHLHMEKSEKIKKKKAEVGLI